MLVFCNLTFCYIMSFSFFNVYFFQRTEKIIVFCLNTHYLLMYYIITYIYNIWLFFSLIIRESPYATWVFSLKISLVWWDLQKWLVQSGASRQSPARRVDSFIGMLWKFYITCRDTGKKKNLWARRMRWFLLP